MLVSWTVWKQKKEIQCSSCVHLELQTGPVACVLLVQLMTDRTEHVCDINDFHYWDQSQGNDKSTHFTVASFQAANILVRKNGEFLRDTAVGGPFTPLCEASFPLNAVPETWQLSKQQLLES